MAASLRPVAGQCDRRSMLRSAACQQPFCRSRGRSCLQPRRRRRASSLQAVCSSTGGAEAHAATAADAFGEHWNGAVCMEDVYDRLAERVLGQLQQRGSSGSPWMVGVAGIPGSGKSSLVHAVADRLNAGGAPAVVVPMDGFHYYRRQLDQMPDPELAHARRGAEWTFDARAYHACLAGIKAAGEGLAPSFDHGVGDPRADDIAVGRHHRVVLSEGNYLLLPAEPWWRLRDLFDDTWFISCCVDEAMGRVFGRQTGNGTAPDVSRWRIAANDRPNAEQIETTQGHARLLVPGQLPLARAAKAA